MPVAAAAVPGPGSGLAVSVLGGLSARRDGVELELGGRRQRGVLALLLLARGAALPPERVIDLLWGESAPAGAAGALQSYVSHLRRALEPGRDARERTSVIVRERGGYACRLPEEAVDAWAFERLVSAGTAAGEPAVARDLLERALSLWRGPGYTEWAGERWADSETARLDELRAVALERLLAARLATGEAAVLVPELEAMTAEEPLREERWRLLALALYRSHRQSDALAALRSARSVLLDELGVDPSPALREVEAQILAQDPALAPEPVPAQPVQPLQPPGAAQPPPRERRAQEAGPDDMVDRDAELERLAACLDDALDGAGVVAVIEGPAGIGKSRLLAEARRSAQERGALVLGARGSVLEREFAFGAVRQLFEPLLLDPAGRERLLAGPAAAAAGVFDDTGSAERSSDSSFAVLHGLYWLVENLAAERRVLLAVDDLQWCDASSLRFLAYLARRLDGLPLLVAVTLRTGEQPAEPALVAEVAHDASSVTVAPGPLSVDGVAGLVRRRLGAEPDAAFVAACHRTTGGNPLLLRQLLRALESDGVRPDASHAGTVTAIGSRAVSSMVLMRLRRLPDAAGAVARAVAVLGDGAALPEVAALAGLSDPDAAAAVGSLAGAEILHDGHPLGFVHPLVREAVYRSIPPGERELAHERASRILAEGTATAEQVAAHLMHVPARGGPEVVAALRRAAAIASDRGAPDSSTTYLARALREPPEPALRARVLLELGSVETLSDGIAAIEHLREAYALADEVEVKAQAALLLCHTLVFAAAPGEAAAFAREASAALPEALVDVRQALLALEVVSAHMHAVPTRGWGDGPLPELVGAGPGARMLAVSMAWDMVIHNRDLPRCQELARWGLADGVLLSADPGLFWVVAAFLLDMADEDLDAFWDDVLLRAHAQGSLFSALATHLWRGHAQWWAGDLREAERSLRLANWQSEKWAGPAIGVSYGEAFLTGVLVDRGQVEQARAFFDSKRWRARIGDGARLNTEAEVALLLAERRPVEALALLDSEPGLGRSIRNPVWAPWRSLRAAALGALGSQREAVALLEEELELVREWGSPRFLGRGLRLLGEQQGAAGEPALRQAVDVLAATRARLELARATMALARVVPDPAEAEALLHRCLDLAERCGADALRTEAATALRAAGAEVREAQEAAVRLTTTERRIATMAARGDDPRRIAEMLFLTPRSVEVTLDSVRRSLGIDDDGQLALALAR
ncbi:BTAD domain-containing putative transcriptional regulator [Motilibacter peucedani]|uniref:BTAD domain-containing putative transcriptional regulator n=1 Tax=Motilibacter peucedani TaxID=598650 RepID=UPI001E62C4DB|nr:BTAD domain-containing putative transcriptional regulator [Motilibacter peucedani]